MLFVFVNVDREHWIVACLRGRATWTFFFTMNPYLPMKPIQYEIDSTWTSKLRMPNGNAYFGFLRHDLESKH
jgi:hypothetical protein